MSTFRISLRVGGELAPLESLMQQHAEQSFQLFPAGERRGRRIQPRNALLLDLAAWERGPIYGHDDREALLRDEDAKLAEVAHTLRRLAPSLAMLDRTRCVLELYISTIRYEDQGGFSLPAELVAVAADAGLSVAISILVLLSDEEDDSSAAPE
jgi:hypothetical protein